MPHRRRGLVRLGTALAAVAAATVTVLVAGGHYAQADVNDSPDHLVVYNNNIENMVPESCYGSDYNHMVSYLKKQPQSPDVFTVQQISNKKQLAEFTKRLSDELPGTYAGQIAVGDPGSMGYTSKCGKLKNQQTNAVIYRSDRLEHKDSTRWRSDAPKDGGPCRNLEPTETSQDRVHNIAVRLTDTVAKRDVSVASIHWPTGKWDGPECAHENMDEANKALDKLGGSLRIFGGDVNTTSGKKDWWSNAGDMGFNDPISVECGARICPPEYDTHGDHRIDFLLAKDASGFSKVANISAKSAGGKYSDHLAVTAYVNY